MFTSIISYCTYNNVTFYGILLEFIGKIDLTIFTGNPKCLTPFDQLLF